jgi:hypothetical protein
MRHARYHEEPIELLDFLPPVTVPTASLVARQLGPDAAIVVDAVDRGDCGVRPSDVVDDLGAMRPKRPEVGIGRIEDCCEVLIGERDIAGEVQRTEVPVRSLKNKVPEEPISEELLRGLALRPVVRQIGIARGADDPGGQLEALASLPGS